MTRPATNFHPYAVTRRERYKNDPEYRAKRQELSRKRRTRRSNMVNEIIGDAKCEVCGEARKWVLHFHHKNPEEKSFDINLARNRAISEDDIRAELAKCICLCANCHLDMHHQESSLTGVIWD